MTNPTKQPESSRGRDALLFFLTIVIVAVIGTILAIYMAGLFSTGIVVPLLFYLLGAGIGYIAGWLIGALFRRAALGASIGLYITGLLSVYVIGYRSTLDRIISGHLDALLVERPSLTKAEWQAVVPGLREDAIPFATFKGIELLIIVLGWIGLYWCVKIAVRTVARRASKA